MVSGPRRNHARPGICLIHSSTILQLQHNETQVHPCSRLMIRPAFSSYGSNPTRALFRPWNQPPMFSTPDDLFVGSHDKISPQESPQAPGIVRAPVEHARNRLLRQYIFSEPTCDSSCHKPDNAVPPYSCHCIRSPVLLSRPSSWL